MIELSPFAHVAAQTEVARLTLRCEELQTQKENWIRSLQDCSAQSQALHAEVERLRKIERAARAAVETEKALGYVSLTLLADVLDEACQT